MDYDNDGDLDVLIANNGRSPSLFRNDNTLSNHYIDIKLVGPVGNVQGVGAKIWVTTNGKTQFRELRLGSNYLSNNPVIAHFGLASESMIESIQVEWPDAERNSSSLTDVPADQTLIVRHPSIMTGG